MRAHTPGYSGPYEAYDGSIDVCVATMVRDGIDDAEGAANFHRKSYRRKYVNDQPQNTETPFDIVHSRLRSAEINSLVEALAKAQGQMENATMDRTNPHFKSRYATLASIHNAARKPLADNGLALSQITEMQGNGMVMITTLYHVSGQWISTEFPLPVLPNPQQMGSILTYTKRYQMSALLMIAADEDDDGNGATKGVPAKTDQTDLISDDQAAELSAALTATKSNIDAFLRMFRIACIPDLPKERFDEAKRLIEKKRAIVAPVGPN